MDMTSATVASNDFLAVLKKQRALAHQSIANPSGGTIGLSADEQLGSLPISNSDALDDALQQIKAVANIGATATADQAQNEITTITNTYMNSARDANASAAFKQQMEQCREHAKANAIKGMDSTYDKAEELGGNLSPSELDALVSFMTNVVESGFSRIINEINDFIVNAIRTLPSWIGHAFDAIKQTFAKIAAFIKSIF
jgi:cell fate (sporulation/competence/biofilm development) regulator YlbF (YheA/YmcA/DUF963 family)